MVVEKETLSMPPQEGQTVEGFNFGVSDHVLMSFNIESSLFKSMEHGCMETTKRPCLC